MNKKYYWLKLKDDFFRNKVIKKLRQIAGGDTYTIIYLKMQLLSLKNNGNLYFDNVEESFYEEIALEIDEDAENVKITILYLIRNGLLEEIAEDEYSLVETKESIGSETASTIRSRKTRQNKMKQIETNQNVLQCNSSATNCNTEIEIEKRDTTREDTEKKIDKPKQKCFVKPTLTEIESYCFERNNNVNAEKFFDFYESKGWMVGKNKMKDWKACVRTWEKTEKESLTKKSDVNDALGELFDGTVRVS